MKSTLKDGAGKNLLFESTIFTGRPGIHQKDKIQIRDISPIKWTNWQ